MTALAWARPDALWLLALVPLFAVSGVWLGVHRGRFTAAALLLRLAVVTLLVVGLAEPLIASGSSAGGAVFVVDRSASVAEAQDTADRWLEEALTATAFSMHPSAAEDAAAALDTLRAAGIPCQIVEAEIEEQYVPEHREYQVMVPNGFSLQATSVLDKEIYNPRLEIEWRTHLESLTDTQFRAMSPDSLCAGFLDRAERLRRIYQEEVARRRAQSRAAEVG